MCFVASIDKLSKEYENWAQLGILISWSVCVIVSPCHPSIIFEGKARSPPLSEVSCVALPG